jgi:membrane protein DedA with SNARE-associated domain
VKGDLSWPLLLVYGALGALCGAWVDLRVGVWLGRRLDQRASQSRLLPPERLAAFEAAYRRWGSWLLLLNRFMPGIRAFIFLAAGASGIGTRRALVLGSLSALVWNALLLAAGALLAHNLEELVGLVERYTQVASGALVLLAVLLVARAAWRRRRKAAAP